MATTEERSRIGKRSLLERLLTKFAVNPDTLCWEWTGAKYRSGYGSIGCEDRRGSMYAHRAMYEALVGEIPESHQVDHLCFNKACVNTDHLEPVTPQENVRRAAHRMRRDDHCRNGHPRTEESTYMPPDGARECAICKRHNSAARPADPEYASAWRERNRDKIREYFRAYRAANKERLNERARTRRQAKQNRAA